MTSPAVIQQLRRALVRGEFFQGATFNYRKDGSSYLVEWNISPIRNHAGEVEAYVSVQHDITARVEAEQLQSLLARALHATEDAVLIADLHAKIIFVNHAFEKQSGYSSAEILGQTPHLLQSGVHSADFYAQLREQLQRGESFQTTFTNRHKNGHFYHASQTITPLKDSNGEVRHYVSVSKDVSSEVEKTQALHKQAHHDALTGLLNRHAGKQQLQRCERLAHSQHRPYSLILADIDAFKSINDNHGHDAGDQILKHCATFLTQSVRRDDHVIRWGGEEFLIILPDCRLEAAHAIAEQMRLKLETWPAPIAAPVTLSIGVAAWCPPQTYHDVLLRADQALYRAKQSGRNQVVAAEPRHDNPNS